MNAESPLKAVALTPYEWHVLLRDLEWLMSISNRSGKQATEDNYARIASQLNDREVRVKTVSDER